MNNVKEYQEENLIQTLIFCRLSSAYEVLIRRNKVYSVYQRTCFTRKNIT